MGNFLKNKTNIIYFAALFLFSFFIFTISYGKFGIFLTDTSREVYIPYAMNEGGVLYKDILNVYPPLGYQINSLLAYIFGDGLKTFYTAGFINSLLFSAGLFSLGGLFARKEDRNLNFLFSMLAITSCIYAAAQDNYIFPYSYSIVYALSSLVWSLFCLLKFIQTEKSLYIILSSFLFGITLSAKYEFIFFAAVIISVLFYKRTDLKTKSLSLAAFLSAPILSVSVLFFQGCSIDILKEWISFIASLSVSKYVRSCYKLLALIPSVFSIKFILLKFIQYFLYAAVFCTAGSILYKLNKSISVIFCIAAVYLLIPVFYASNAYYFNAFGMINILLLCFLLFYWIKKYRNKTLNIQDEMFIILFLSVILISLKSIFSINLSNYGAYFAPFILLCVFFSIHYYLKEILYYDIKIPLCLLFAVLTFTYLFSNHLRRNYAFNFPLYTEKGVIYAPREQAQTADLIIKYISRNTKLEDKILIMPEGAFINYLTNRKSNNKYYYLIPPNIEIFNEEKIKEDLENNLPEYIIILPSAYHTFGETHFCESFGLKICALLPKYYETPLIFGNSFPAVLYKKRNEI